MAAMVATMPFDPASSSAGPCMPSDQAVVSGAGEPEQSEAQVSRKEAVLEAPAAGNDHSGEQQESSESSSGDEGSEEDDEGDGEDDDDSSQEAAVTDDDVARDIDWLMEVESEAAEAQEALEEESLNRVARDVRAELAEKFSGAELEAAVKKEMDDYIEMWDTTLQGLEEESSKLQDKLEKANVSLPDLFKAIEKQASDGSVTEAWRKRAHWAGTQASEDVSELVKSAQDDLERQRPVMSRRGKLVEEGASGFLESKRKDLDDGNTSAVGWTLLDELSEPKPTVEKASNLFNSKSWASVYSASTPEQAARLGLKFPGVNKVEEIGDIDDSLGLEAMALAEESAHGLTELQKKKLKRVREDDDLLEMKKSPRKKKPGNKHKDKQVQAPNGAVPLAQAQAPEAEKTSTIIHSDAPLFSDTSTSANVVENPQTGNSNNLKDSTVDDAQVHIPDEVLEDVQKAEGECSNDHVEAAKDDKPVEESGEHEQRKEAQKKQDDQPAEESPEHEEKKEAQKKPELDENETTKMKAPPKVIIAKSDPPTLIVVSDSDDDDADLQKRSSLPNNTTPKSRKREHQGSSPRSTKKRKIISDSSDDENNNINKKLHEVFDVSSSDEKDIPSTSREALKLCKCTICNKLLAFNEVVPHPVLRVIACQKCKERYEKIQFTEHEGTDAECTWCGQIGSMLCCDKCTRVFCEGCIERNTGKLGEIASLEDWHCFVCDSSALKEQTRRLEEALEGRATPVSSQTSRGKRRKNIRTVRSDDELNETTKKMQEIEKERQERLKKWYETASGEKTKVPFGKCRASAESSDEGHLCVGDCKTLGCVINITERDSDQPLVRIPPSLSKHLKPHQLSGVRFMWENCIESVSKVMAGSKGLGCILAHCMGLGKTLQVITFLYTAMRAVDLKTVLVVVPVNVLHNWKSEFSKWQPLEVPQLSVYILDDYRDNATRAGCLKNWKDKGGVMLIGYASFRILCIGKNVKDSETRALIRQYLQDPGPDILVCDEAHTIKNKNADITQELQQVKSRRRIALTGSPLQNNLMEYYCMVNFVREGLLGRPDEFRNRFQNPIANGQHADSTSTDVRKMKQRAHVLHSRLEGFVQRRDSSVLNPEIPAKGVWIISVRLSPLQKELYKKYLSTCSGHGRDFLKDFHALVKIWNHPDVLSIAKDHAKDTKDAQRFIVDSDKDEEAEENAPAAEKKGENAEENGATAAEKRKGENAEVNNFEWCQEILSASERNVLENGGKLVVLLRLLAMSFSQGEKMLVFSHSLVTLDLVESFLENTPLPSGAGAGNWTRGKDWYRFDGSTPAAARHRLANNFNDPSNTTVKCCLISTRAGSLGINLTGASRVVIVDGSWNPTHDLQALFRAWRLGQTKPVFAYRLLAYGTLEEKIYHRQLAKEGIAARVLDARQVGRHLNADDLDFLYTFDGDDDEDPEENTQAEVRARKAKPKAFTMPSDAPPRDELMAMLLLEYRPRVIASYHEHEPLLEDLEDEKLSPEEKLQAWEAFKIEHEPQLAQGEGSAQAQQSTPRPAPAAQSIPRPAFGAQQQQSTPRPVPGAQQQQQSTPRPDSTPRPAGGAQQQQSIPRSAPQQQSTPRAQQQQQSIPKPAHQQQQQQQSNPRPVAAAGAQQTCTAASHVAELQRLRVPPRGIITCGKCYQQIGGEAQRGTG